MNAEEIQARATIAAAFIASGSIKLHADEIDYYQKKSAGYTQMEDLLRIVDYVFTRLTTK
jgi:hypothetical protein